jgi:LCP family protein required for cell wall assembly
MAVHSRSAHVDAQTPAADGGSAFPHAPAPPTPCRGARRRGSLADGRMPSTRPPWRTVLIAVAALLIAGAGLVVGAITWSVEHFSSHVERVSRVFPDGGRPSGSPESLTFLTVGLEPVAGSLFPDAIALVHVTGDRSAVQVVFLPVDATLDVPRGGAPALRDVFTSGGPSALVQAVEGASGVRIDHYVEMDFTGFRAITDALGGVEADIPAPFSNRGHTLAAGRQHLDGDAALAYLRFSGRPDAGAPELREQVLVTALFDRLGQMTSGDIRQLQNFTEALTGAVRVDDTLSDTALVQLAWSLRGVARPKFVTVPVAGQGGSAVPYLDQTRAAAVWRYLREDSLGDHVTEFR